MAEIVLDHVSKRFPDGTMAVDDANLDIDASSSSSSAPRAAGSRPA